MEKENQTKTWPKKMWAFVTKSKIAKITTLLAIPVVMIVAYLLITANLTEKVSSEYISGKLTKASELTTAKLNYTGMSEFKDAGIKYINRSDFVMVYHSTARAGIDMKDVKVRVDEGNKIIHIQIPKAKVLDVKIDPNSIKYYNTSFALINTNEKEDANKAQSLAEKAAMKEIEGMGILDTANTQAKTLIKGILEGVTRGYKLEFTSNK